MMKSRWSVVLGIFLAGCASFDANSANAPLASRADVAMTYGRGPSYTVRSTVYRGAAMPRCELPDAANEIRCSFYWDHLKKFSGGDDWRGLDMRSAHALCSQAVWTLGQIATPSVIRVCAFNLIHIRFADLQPDDVAPENQ